MTRPAVAYLIEAQTIARALEVEGIVLTREQALALAHAKLGPPIYWLDDEPVLSETARMVLDQIVAERAGDHHVSTAHDQALDLDLSPDRGRDSHTPGRPSAWPKRSTTFTPKVLGYPEVDKQEQGQGDSSAREQYQNRPVQNGDIDRNQDEDQRQARRLARLVATIPEKSRETIVGRLQAKGQDPTDAEVWRQWQYHVHLTRDRPTDEWS